MKIPKCDCGQDCMDINRPLITIINIPFIKIQLRIANYYKVEYQGSCLHCLIDLGNSVMTPFDLEKKSNLKNPFADFKIIN